MKVAPVAFKATQFWLGVRIGRLPFLFNLVGGPGSFLLLISLKSLLEPSITFFRLLVPLNIFDLGTFEILINFFLIFHM